MFNAVALLLLQCYFKQGNLAKERWNDFQLLNE